MSFLSLVENDRVFLRDTFEATLMIIAAKKLPIIGYDIHQKDLMTSVMFQYLILRFRCFGEKKFIEIVEKKRIESHKKMKLKKFANFVRKYLQIMCQIIKKKRGFCNSNVIYLLFIFIHL